MKKGPKTASIALMLIVAVATFLPAIKTTSARETGTLKIAGMMNTPLNLSHAELLSFPMVSEVARLKCVDGSPDLTITGQEYLFSIF